MKSRESRNPDNRFHKQTVAYDDGESPRPAHVVLLEDHSRTLLSENDSPDVGFRWSANPYRGCVTACAYCLCGDTPILMGDARQKPLREVRVGDEIFGTVVRGTQRKLVRTIVQAHWATHKLAYRVTLADGTTLVASGDHRFLTERGWKYVAAPEPHAQRPILTTDNTLIGFGALATPPPDTAEYRRGYLCGMIRRYDDSGRRHDPDVQHHLRLALIDLEALHRVQSYLAARAIDTHEFQFAEARAGYQPMRAIRTHADITEIVAWPDAPSDDWRRGFVAGIFDAEGTRSRGILRISNTDPRMIDETATALAHFGFRSVVERIDRAPRPIMNVRLRGGLTEQLRFFHSFAPAISRKWDLADRGIRTRQDLRVTSVERLDVRDLFDITTGTGDFIANGVVSHNCYARPTHEYLDMGAGTDFDTKIVVKRNAPALLREAFDKPSWRGELVMFSGVTDCYQPVERDLELTRRCLEVCLEYRNPASVISKHALVGRDIDLFAALARDARFHLSVSLAWTDAEMARQIEPWAPSPERRLKTIELLAKAGVPVGVMAAPIIPGLNDSQLVGLLERAANAGATTAGWVLLRLPGAVAQVFPERLRAAMPLAADKVLHRIRETRGGTQLYKSEFHTRGRGEGPYADTIATIFETTCKRLGLNRRDGDDETTTFRRPPKPTAQLTLF